jgi:hypothetical protein
MDVSVHFHAAATFFFPAEMFPIPIRLGRLLSRAGLDFMEISLSPVPEMRPIFCGRPPPLEYSLYCLSHIRYVVLR